MKRSNPRPRAKIPAPAHPQRRREPLPWNEPKAIEDDAEARERVRELMKSASYRRAETDVDFLSCDELQGVRLQMDYAKTEVLLSKHRIRKAVVAFGSARICEPAAAKRKVDALRAALAAAPDDVELKRKLSVAERVFVKSRYYDVAREFGRLVSNANPVDHRNHTIMMTGGGPGIMEAANRGAFDVGAKTAGLNISLPHEQYPNPYISPDLCFSFSYFALRKMHLMRRAMAVVAFPGGFGTFDEIFEVLALIQTRKMKPVPVVLVGESFWRQAFNVDFLADEGVIDVEDRELFWYAETAQEIWDGIVHWHAVSGVPLHPRD